MILAKQQKSEKLMVSPGSRRAVMTLHFLDSYLFRDGVIYCLVRRVGVVEMARLSLVISLDVRRTAP